MATYTQVNSATDAIAKAIDEVEARVQVILRDLQQSSTKLGALPTQYSDAIATIDGYTPTGAFETLAKDKAAKYATEFTTLKNKIDAAIAELE